MAIQFIFSQLSYLSFSEFSHYFLVSMSLDTLAAICIAKEKAQFFFVSFAIYVPCNETVPPTGIDHLYEIQRRLAELSELTTGPLSRDRSMRLRGRPSLWKMTRAVVECGWCRTQQASLKLAAPFWV